MDARLNNRDLDILLEALDVWEKCADDGIVMKGVLGAMLVSNNPESKTKYELEMKREEAARELKLKERKKISTMLKAKLFTLQEQSMDRPSGLTIDQITE